MSGGDNDGGIRIDTKILSLLIFLAAQLGAAIWWAAVKTSEVASLREDMDKLTTHIDKQLDRMEQKIDKLRGP